MKAKNEVAEKFQAKVADEIIPSIRKTGGYQSHTPQGKELLALAVLEAQKTIEEQAAEIGRMKPKEIFADAVSTSHTAILIGDLAKILKQNGIETGQKRLFSWLRENGYLIKRKGTDWNMPTQKSMEMGLFGKIIFSRKESVFAEPFKVCSLCCWQPFKSGSFPVANSLQFFV